MHWRHAPDLISQFLYLMFLSTASTPGANSPWAKPRRKRSPEAASHYEPPRAGGSLETVIAEQMAWITAWRIDRYARGSMLKTPFYQRATNTEALPAAQGGRRGS
jgi:hypothetical protein